MPFQFWLSTILKEDPKELNGIKFIEQNMDQATKECDDGGRPKPEFVPTVRDGEPNLALMVGAKPSVSDQISDGGYCPKPHNPITPEEKIQGRIVAFILTMVSIIIIEVGLARNIQVGSKLTSEKSRLSIEYS